MLLTEIQTINSFYLEKESEYDNLFKARYRQEVKDMVRSPPQTPISSVHVC